MKIMTFNLRNAIADDGVNSWQFRKDFVFDYLKEICADIICMQEVVPLVKQQIIESLSSVYDFIGEGRMAEDRADDEINLIAYKKSKLRLIDSEHFWLSDTPSAAGSKFDPIQYWPRTCTKAQFKTENDIVTIFATHLDCDSENAREKGLKLIMKKAGNDSTFICGDFNDLPDKINKWTGDNFYDLTNKVGDTYNGFGKEESKKIDYILSNTIKKSKQSFCDIKHKNEIYISDHYPVIIEI